MKIRSPRDLWAGLMFIAFGLTALWFGRHLAMGTSVRMGPGYVPHMLAYIMMVLGLIIAVVALYSGGEVAEAPKWRPITLVTVGIVVFALLFETTGMFPSLVALVLMPIILYYLYPPEIKHTPNATGFAKERLKEMGPMSRGECFIVAAPRRWRRAPRANPSPHPRIAANRSCTAFRNRRSDGRRRASGSGGFESARGAGRAGPPPHRETRSHRV